METQVIHVKLGIHENISVVCHRAADLLATGQIVALPTETVYGLAADAFCEHAVAQVFAVKDRPHFDPLICHFPTATDVYQVTCVPPKLQPLVRKLAQTFWPGPMTLVLPRKECIPDIVTSGLPTVACRVPLHPIMRGVARALGHPIAAPSANRFGRISPTNASAVLRELGGRIPLIVDAGACSEGLESTILLPCFDEKGKPAVQLLRHGPLTREKLRTICRIISSPKSRATTLPAPCAPGQLPVHYAPLKPLYLCNPKEPFRAPIRGLAYGLISYSGDSTLARSGDWIKVMALSPGSGRLTEAAVRLFAVMRAMDELECVRAIVAETLPETGLGRAMMDRLRRAAANTTSSPVRCLKS